MPNSIPSLPPDYEANPTHSIYFLAGAFKTKAEIKEKWK